MSNSESESCKPNHKIVIPEKILKNNKIEANAKIFLGELIYFFKSNEFFHIPNEFFSNLYEVDEKTIERWSDSLVNENILKIINFEQEEAIKILKEKIPQKFTCDLNFDNNFCNWCKCHSYLLHKHHHPIRKKYGGIKTIDICANCHQEFHFLCDYRKFKILWEMIC